MRQNLKELPAQAWLLTIGATINRFASFATVFLVLYLRSHGFSLPKAGAAVAAVGIGELVASVLGGHLADRIGRRNTIALSMFCSAASMLASPRTVGGCGEIDSGIEQSSCLTKSPPGRPCTLADDRRHDAAQLARCQASSRVRRRSRLRSDRRRKSGR